MEQHPGAEQLPSVQRCAKLNVVAKLEAKIVTRLKAGCAEGGWVNLGIDCGDYAHYQGKNVIAVQPLRSAVEAAEGAEGITQALRGWGAVAKLVPPSHT